MKVSILKTDGGPHSAEKWAAATAGSIIEVASSAAGQQELEGRRLELKILDILEKWHDAVQKKERDKLHKGHDWAHKYDVYEHVNLDDVVKEICEAGKATQWKEHFEKPEVIAAIKYYIGTDFATSMQIERFWHADKNPTDPKAVAFKKKYHG